MAAELLLFLHVEMSKSSGVLGGPKFAFLLPNPASLFFVQEICHQVTPHIVFQSCRRNGWKLLVLIGTEFCS